MMFESVDRTSMRLERWRRLASALLFVGLLGCLAAAAWSVLTDGPQMRLWCGGVSNQELKMGLGIAGASIALAGGMLFLVSFIPIRPAIVRPSISRDTDGEVRA